MRTGDRVYYPNKGIGTVVEVTDDRAKGDVAFVRFDGWLVAAGFRVADLTLVGNTSERYEAHPSEPSQTDPHVFDTLSRHVVEDLLTFEEAIGRAQEYNEEAFPRCEHCGMRMDENPTPFADNPWNGETGNHQWCEEHPDHFRPDEA